jgi:large conductance mechanosensitive channel
MAKSFFAEFKEFAERGNAIDMAVGVIAGAAMNSVVNSLVKDIIMPPIGMMLGNMDMSAIAIRISDTTTIGIGLFMNSLVSFILTMFAVFLFVRVMNKLRTAEAATTRECPYCKTQISVDATKCPNCCSAVKPVKVAAPEEGEVGKIIGGIGDMFHKHTPKVVAKKNLPVRKRK